MSNHKKNLIQYSTKFFLWLLRRPMGIWLVLIFSITSAISPLMMMFANIEQTMSVIGLTQFIEISAPYLFLITACILAGLFAFFLRKESIVLFIIYFLLYFLNALKAYFINPFILLAGSFQIVLSAFVLIYLLQLKKSGYLK